MNNETRQSSSLNSPQQESIRRVLRRVGPIVVVVGALFTAIGLWSFFSSLGSFGPPKYFWCCFVGMPLGMFGLALCKFGYMGDVLRYMAGETAPVGKDTFNYMAEGTAPGVRTMASALREGFTGEVTETNCPECQAANSLDAKFCQSCGSGLMATCSGCQTTNDRSAKFCDECGQRLAAS